MRVLTLPNRLVTRAVVMLVIGGAMVAAISLNEGCATSGPSTETAGPGILSLDDAQFIEELTAAVLDSARVAPGGSVADQPANTSGGTLIRPGGGEAYPAFWIRDFAMSLDSGLITLDEQRHALLQTAFHQQDGQMMLPNGARVPQGSVPDHITFDGVPIFFPGTLDDYVGQGGGAWGTYPCFDNPFFFIHMAYYYVHAAEDYSILQTKVRDRTLLKRLQLAYSMPPHNTTTGLVTCTEANRGVNFGFTDTVEHTGELLVASLLKLRAAIQLAALMDSTGNRLAGDLYREDAVHIREAIAVAFPLESGFLRASTGRSAQPDVWGTALAVYLGVLPGELEARACLALSGAYQAGTIARNGYIRHVPTDADFSGAMMWESSTTPNGRYQHGGYWGTPTGWVVYAIARIDRGLAQKLTREYVSTLREGDFRKGRRGGEPSEYAQPNGGQSRNAPYVTTVTAPLSAFRRLDLGR